MISAPNSEKSIEKQGPTYILVRSRMPIPCKTYGFIPANSLKIDPDFEDTKIQLAQ